MPGPGNHVRDDTERVTEVLDAVILERGVSTALSRDNGTEFTSKHFDAWAFAGRIQLGFIRPGKPVENNYIEASTASLETSA